MEVKSNAAKSNIAQESGMSGSWIKQGKLEVDKHEMTRVDIDILGISELKWTGMGELNSDNHYITTVGKNPLEEME